IASAIVGAYLALFMPLPSRMVAQEAAERPSLPELLSKGVRHEITRPVNILIMGIDRVPGAEAGDEELFSGRSDTMLLVQVNPEDQSIRMLSIPRDTQVSFPGMRGVTKINHANALGGPRLAAEVVSHNLGDIEVDRYIRFSTDAFRELVDLLGGVEVFVPNRMYYVDQTQDLTIDLEPGLQMLDGDQAEQFARFRADGNGDIGRVQRQQILIRALRDRFISPSVIPRVPQILQLLDTHIDTNLSTEELLALATFGMDMDQDSLQMVMLPGTFSSSRDYIASYWLMDDVGVRRVLDSYFGVSSITYATDLNRQYDNVDNSLDGQVPYGESSSDSRVGRSLQGLRIAVQNASGTPLVARQVVGYLREQGLTQVYAIDDWPLESEQTQIIVQNGHLRGAESLGDVLGIGDVVPASTGDLGSDLTIRVGRDWVQRVSVE
ncbi:MAG: LCP family protein, partial [Leptolyngbyaceae bacterium]|nr:LCP family protein [Leptolyngbyaceae bacterium]